MANLMVRDLPQELKFVSRKVVRLRKSFEKHLEKLSDEKKEQIREKIGSLKSKYKSLVSMQSYKSRGQIDKMFFSFEDLPPFGKEYWFMTLTSTARADRRQLLAMFGNMAEGITINGKKAEPLAVGNNRRCHSTVWLFDKKKELLADENGLISVDGRKGAIKAISKAASVSFSGKFPDYRLSISERGRRVCDLKISSNRKVEKAYGFHSLFKLFAGSSLIDLYLQCEGTLNGKPFKGESYLQKVVLVGPFVPWQFGRILFENGSALTYYSPRIELAELKYEIQSELRFYDATTGKEHVMNGFDVRKTAGRLPRFVLVNRETGFSATFESYSRHDFVFKKIGKFRYVEYLTKVSGLSTGTLGIDVGTLGSGIGLVEDTEGYCI